MIDPTRDHLRGRYEADGYVVLRPPWLARQAEVLRRCVEAVDRAVTSRSHPFIAAPHRISGGETILDFARNDELLDLVEQILGHDLVLFGSTVFWKSPVTGPAVAWHQDGSSWPVTPMDAVNVWIPLCPATRANGCLQMLRGSHRHGRYWSEFEPPTPHLHDSFDEHGEAKSERVDFLELVPGEMSFHHPATLHRSEANTSPHPRIALAIYYMSASARYVRAPDGRTDPKFFERPIWLVRGKDIAGNARQVTRPGQFVDITRRRQVD